MWSASHSDNVDCSSLRKNATEDRHLISRLPKSVGRTADASLLDTQDKRDSAAFLCGLSPSAATMKLAIRCHNSGERFPRRRYEERFQCPNLLPIVRYAYPEPVGIAVNDEAHVVEPNLT